MTEPTDLLEHAMQLITEPESGVAEVHDRLARRQRNRRLAVGAVVVAIWLVIGVVALAFRSPDDAVPIQPPPPSPTVSPGSVDARGWPGGGHNPAGVYSWNALGSDSQFMHNHYSQGHGDVYVDVSRERLGRLVPHHGQPVTVFGYEGTYRRFTSKGRTREEWMVDIRGTTVTLGVLEQRESPQTELAEAHEIIESIRVEVPAETGALGFRLIFTLTTNNWQNAG